MAVLASCSDYSPLSNNAETAQSHSEKVQPVLDTTISSVIARTPYDDAPNISPYTILEWSNPKATLGTVYHVYFDTLRSPVRKLTECTTETCLLPVLRDSTFYYWFVVADNGITLKRSKTFMFRTMPSGLSSTLGLVAYYPFNGDAKDVFGKHNGEVVGNALPTEDKFGNPKAAYSFNGTSQYIRVKNSGELNFINTYTLCVWVKPSPTVGSFFQDRVYLVSYWGEGGNNLGAYALSLTNSLTPVSMIHDGLRTTQFVSPVSIKANEWSHVVITRDMNSVMHIYVNGKQVAEQTMTSPQNSRYDLLFGASFTYSNNTCAYFAGSLDNIRIYNRSLNTSEISVLYKKGL